MWCIYNHRSRKWWVETACLVQFRVCLIWASFGILQPGNGWQSGCCDWLRLSGLVTMVNAQVRLQLACISSWVAIQRGHFLPFFFSLSSARASWGQIYFDLISNCYATELWGAQGVSLCPWYQSGTRLLMLHLWSNILNLDQLSLWVLNEQGPLLSSATLLIAHFLSSFK